MLKYCCDKSSGTRFLVIYNISRLSRNVTDYHQTLALLAGRNISVRSATETMNETPEGSFMSGLMALMADFDNRLKAQRTVVGMKAAILSGRWTHGAPLGYLTGLKGGGIAGPSLIPDADRAHLVRLAFEQIASGVLKQFEVLQNVTAAGLRTRTGRPLSPQSFHKMLRKPIYAGRICVKNLGENMHADFEPLVSPETFERAQQVLAGKRPALKPRLRDHDFPLRVFARCGDCGTPLTGSWSTGRGGKKYAHYACRKRLCRGVKSRKDVLEGEFVSFLRNLLPKPSTTDAPLTSPAISTNSTTAGTSGGFLPSVTSTTFASASSRSSGTGTTPILGSIVVNG